MALALDSLIEPLSWLYMPIYPLLISSTALRTLSILLGSFPVVYCLALVIIWCTLALLTSLPMLFIRTEWDLVYEFIECLDYRRKSPSYELTY